MDKPETRGGHSLGRKADPDAVRLCAEELIESHKTANTTQLYTTLARHTDEEVLLAVEMTQVHYGKTPGLDFKSLLSSVLLEIRGSGRKDLSEALLDKHNDVFLEHIFNNSYVSVSLLPDIFEKARQTLDKGKLDVLVPLYLRAAIDQAAAGSELGLVLIDRMRDIDISDIQLKSGHSSNKAIALWAKLLMTGEKPTDNEIKNHQKFLARLLEMNCAIDEKEWISDGRNETPVYTSALGWLVRVLDQQNEMYARVGLKVLVEAGADWTEYFNANKRSGEFLLTLPEVSSWYKRNRLVDALPQDMKAKIDHYTPAKPKF